MWVVSDAYRAAIARPHQVITRATVAKGGQPLYAGKALPVVGGSVTVSSGSAVRRTCDLVIAPRLPGERFRDEPAFPLEAEIAASTPLGTDGQEVTVRSGLVYPSGRIEWVPLGVFRVDDVAGSLMDRTPVAVSGVSREAWQVDDTFATPRVLQGASTVAVIRDLILESYSRAEVAVLTRADRRLTPTLVDRDRWGAVTDLADSLGCVVYADAEGRYVIAAAPTLRSRPSFTFRAGPGGIATDVAGRRTRRPIFNQVAVVGSTPEGDTEPVLGVATDDRAGSRTRFGDPADGAWGRKTLHVSQSALTSDVACEGVARATLARVTGAGSTLDVTAVPLYPLDAGDVVDVVADHRNPVRSVSRHIVDDFTIPLTAGERFSVSTRDLGEV